MEDRLRVGVITIDPRSTGEVKVFPTTDDAGAVQTAEKGHLLIQEKKRSSWRLRASSF